MKCSKCGYENNENFSYCPTCGNKVEPEQSTDWQTQNNNSSYAYGPQVTLNPVAERALRMFKDNLFLVLCILFSSGTGINMLGRGFSVIDILMTIFLWLIYAASRKGIADHNYMRCISGTIYASYIISFVCFCIVAVCGLLCSFILAAVSGSGILSQIYSQAYSYLGNYTWLFNNLASVSVIILGIVIVIVAAGGILITIFGLRSIHAFAQSLYQSVAMGQLNIVKRSTAQTWMFAFGVIDAVFAVFSLLGGNFEGFLAGLCKAGAFILANNLISRYFADCQ